MKKILMLLLLLASLIGKQDAMADDVTQHEAFTAVVSQFAGQDVDYFILDASDPLYSGYYWYFFVDAEPMKGWQHDCYLVSVPKMKREKEQ